MQSLNATLSAEASFVFLIKEEKLGQALLKSRQTFKVATACTSILD